MWLATWAFRWFKRKEKAGVGQQDYEIRGRRHETLGLLQKFPTKELRLPQWPLLGILRTQSDEQHPFVSVPKWR
jgi:hypothetical protein